MAHQKARSVRHDDARMIGLRSRDRTGKLRQKRGDALVRTIEAHYGVDFQCRSDMRLETLRKEVGLTGIKGLIEAARAAAKVGLMQSADERSDPWLRQHSLKEAR